MELKSDKATKLVCEMYAGYGRCRLENEPGRCPLFDKVICPILKIGDNRKIKK